MTEPDPRVIWHQVQGWMRHASDDERIARGCLKFEPPALGGAAYHCQQAVEKLLKGFLALAGIDFRKTHDLTALGNIVSRRFPSLLQMLPIQSAWTAWGVAYRYPTQDEPEPEPTPEELSAALDMIRATRGSATVAWPGGRWGLEARWR